MANDKTVKYGSYIVITILSSFMILNCAKAPRQENFYGVWRGESQGKELLFSFNDNGTCELSFKDNATGETEVLTGNFEMDFSKRPIPLSVRNIPRLNYPLHTIVEFIEADSIRIAYFAQRWRLRPIAFNYKNTMNLKRADDSRNNIK